MAQNIFLHYWKLYRFTNMGLKFVFHRTKGLRFEDGLWNQTKPIVKAKILPLHWCVFKHISSKGIIEKECAKDFNWQMEMPFAQSTWLCSFRSFMGAGIWTLARFWSGELMRMRAIFASWQAVNNATIQPWCLRRLHLFTSPMSLA